MNLHHANLNVEVNFNKKSGHLKYLLDIYAVCIKL